MLAWLGMPASLQACKPASLQAASLQQAGSRQQVGGWAGGRAGRQVLTVEAVVIATDRVTSARARYVTTLLAVPPGQLPTMHSLQAGGEQGQAAKGSSSQRGAHCYLHTSHTGTRAHSRQMHPFS